MHPPRRYDYDPNQETARSNLSKLTPGNPIHFDKLATHAQKYNALFVSLLVFSPASRRHSAAVGKLFAPMNFATAQVHLFEPLVFHLLVPNVVADRVLVSPNRGHGESPGPKVLPSEFAFALSITIPGQMDGAPPLNLPDDLRHGKFRWN